MKIADSEAPIGVFDSGVGGLTVVSELMRQMPRESIVYFGDSARYPYGPRSPERVRSMAMEDGVLLTGFDVKMIVVACNTASSHALDMLAEKLPVPVIGVVKPGAYAAARQTRSGKIGVIGTDGTIASESYKNALEKLNDQITCKSMACPLFVALAEEGWTVGPIARMVAEAYLAELRLEEIDTLILGCTHFPLLRSVISETLGEEVELIDSAEATVSELRRRLESASGLREGDGKPVHRFLVSDAPERFKRIGERFLGRPLGKVLKVDLEDDVGLEYNT